MRSLVAALLALLFLLAACQATPTGTERYGNCRYPGQSPECRGLHTG